MGQTALNFALDCNIDIIDTRWNVIMLSSGVRLPVPFTDQARILHFNGLSKGAKRTSKPWHPRDTRPWMNDELYEYPRMKCPVLNMLQTGGNAMTGQSS